jgi:WD40 repeat protein
MRFRAWVTAVVFLMSSTAGSEAAPDGPVLPDGVLRLGSARLRHPDEVRAVAFSPDGKWIASADTKGRIRLWDSATGELRREFPEKTGTVFAFSPDGKYLATAGMATRDGVDQLRIWSVADGKQCTGVKKEWWGPLCFTPDGLSLVCSDGVEVVLVSADTGAEVRRFKGLPHRPLSVNVSRDGKWIAAGDYRDVAGTESTILVWDAKTGKERCKITDENQGWVHTVAFSPSGAKLASATPYHASLWDADTGKHLDNLGEDATSDVAFDKEGKRLVTAGDLSLIDPKNNVLLRTLGQRQTAERVAISPDGTRIASIGSNAGRVRLWDADTGKELLVSAHSRDIHSVAYSPDGKWIATGSDDFEGDGSVRLWDAATGTEVRVLASDPARRSHARSGAWALSFTANGTVLTAGTLRWDVASGRALPPAPTPEDRHAITYHSPDGRLIASVDTIEGGIQLFDAKTGKRLHRINPDNPGNVARRRGRSGVVFSPDGKRLVVTIAPDFVGNRDREPPVDTLVVFDTESGRRLNSFRPRRDWAPSALAFTKDGTQLVTAILMREPPELWDVATGTLIREFKGQDGNDWSRFRPVALSADGQLLATGGPNNTVVVWEVASGKVIQILTGHAKWSRVLAFSPDGLRVVSGGADTMAFVWPALPPNKGAVQPDKWDATTGEKLWKSLASEPEEAYPAVGALITTPDRATAVLKDRLKPDSEPDPKEVARLLVALNSKDEAARDAAASDLRRLGSAIEPALYRAARSDDQEFNRRVRRVLRAMASPDPDAEELRRRRAVFAPERMGTPGAEAVLETLARGRDAGAQTVAARAALLRLEETRKKAVRPVVAPVVNNLGAKPKRLYGHANQVLAVAFTPDGKIAISAGIDGKVRRWDVVAGRELPVLTEHPNGAFAVAVAPNGKRIATAGADAKVRIFDATGREERELKGHDGPVYAVAFSPDGSLVATGGRDGTARVWDSANGKQQSSVTVMTREGAELNANAGGVTGVTFAPDGKELITTGVRPHGNTIDDRFVPNYAPDKVRVWSLATGAEVRTLSGVGHTVTVLPGGRVLVAAVTSRGTVIRNGAEGPLTIFDGHAAVVDLKTGRVEREHDGGAGAGSIDGRLFASGIGSPVHIGGLILPAKQRPAESEWLRLWEAASGKETLSIAVDTPVALTFSPDGKHILYGTGDGDVGLADVLPSNIKAPADRAGLEAAWEALRSEDAAAAYRAVVALALSPKEAPAFLKLKLHPAPVDDSEMVQLIADLDANRFAVREATRLELARRGAEAVPALQVALTRTENPNVRRQIENLLATPGTKVFPDPLRRVRAVWALERIGTPEAKAVIASLPGGN